MGQGAVIEGRLEFSAPSWSKAAAALVVLVQVAEWRGLPVPDVSWLLYVTQEVARGAVYGVDVVDVSPPPIIWYSRPAVWISQALSLSSWHAFHGWLLATGVVALLLLGAVSRCAPGWTPGFRGRLQAAGWLAVLAVPWGLSGEREHVALMLVLPYVVLFAVREDLGRVPAILAVATGALAGFGFAIKPHFAVVWVVLAALATRQRRGLPVWRRTEFLVATLVGLACVLLVLLLEPGYVRYMLQLGPHYQVYLRQTLAFVALKGEANGAAAVLLTVVAAAVLRGTPPPPVRPAVVYLVTAAAAFYLGAALQLKGWRYHYVPAVSLAFMALSLLSTHTRFPGQPLVVRLYRGAAVGAIAALLASTFLATTLRLQGSAQPTVDPDFDRLLAVVRRDGFGRPLAVLSSNLASSFPLTTEAGVKSATRFGGVQPWLAAFYAEALDSGTVVRVAPVSSRHPFERQLGKTVVADLRRHQPGLIVVPAPRDSANYLQRFDYLAYFAAYPGFTELLGEYRELGMVGIYHVYQHRSLTPGTMTGAWREPPLAERPSAPFSGSGERLLVVFVAAAAVLVLWARQGRPVP